MTDMQTPDVKADAHRIIDNLPAGATWDDVMYGIYVRQTIEAGIADADNNDVVDVDEVRRQFGLAP